MEPSPAPLKRPSPATGYAGREPSSADGSVAGKIVPDHSTRPGGAFTPEHLAQIAAARKSSTKIRHACAVAKFSGITTAVFAALTVVFSLTSFSGLLLGMGMAIVSIFEFRGAAELTRLDRTAPKRLAMNQLAFATMLIIYGMYSLWSFFHDASPDMSDAMSQLASLMGTKEGDLRKSIAMIWAGAIFLVALAGPGLASFYYYTRTRYIDDYVSNTPQWIQDLQKAGMSL